jgi:hypothetical protein
MEIPVESLRLPVRPGIVREWRWWVIAMILPSCAVLLTRPFADLGFDDDWTYAFIALRYAQSGTLQFNGFNEPFTILQAVYGGLLIRMFGFSFDLLRLATIPFAAGCAGLTYLLSRRAELPPRVSLFTAFTATTSPLFLPFAASFMTDVYGCFFFLLCLLFGIYAIDSVKPTHAAAWLLASLAAGHLGGADRQICWVAVVAVLMCFAWRKRQVPSLLFLAALLAIVSAVAIRALMRWYARQPNAFIQIPEWQDLHRIREFLPSPAIRYGLSTIRFCLPALLLFPSLTRLTPRRLGLLIAAALLWMTVGHRDPNLLAPWMHNIVTASGILIPELWGDKPVVLGPVSQGILTALVVLVIGALVQQGLPRLSSFLRAGWKEMVWAANRTQTFAELLALSVLGCLVIVAVRAVMRESGSFGDDYMLPWLPLFLILLLLALYRPDMELNWRLGWTALAVFAAYGIATTHDFYSEARARVGAFERLEMEGIAPRHVDGGLEPVEWTQLMTVGYTCNPSARPPSGDPACRNVLDPRYFLAFSAVPDFVPSRFAPEPYRTWLPPYRQQVLILTRPHK